MSTSLINVSYLEEVCGGDREIILEMIEIFREQIKEFSGEFRSLYSERKFFELGLMAHKAKSSVAIMGMEDMALKLKELEQKAKAGEDWETYQAYINEFSEQTAIAEAELEAYINNL